MDLTLEAFSLFSHDKDDVKLYLYQGLIQPAEYSELLAYIDRFGLADKVKLTSPSTEVPAQVHLNKVYNACDIGINTSAGEGWGLVSFEHAATGAAQLVPAHSACEELWQGIGFLIDVRKEYRPRFPLHNIMYEIDPVSAANALNNLYQNHELRDSISQRCYEFTTKTQYKWSEIARKWLQILE